MYVCMYVCVCVYVCVYVCMCVCVHVCICTSVIQVIRISAAVPVVSKGAARSGRAVRRREEDAAATRAGYDRAALQEGAATRYNIQHVLHRISLEKSPTTTAFYYKHTMLNTLYRIR